MRKQTKLAVGVSAAALLAIGASMTSFAANRGWTNEGDAWYYYDNSGDYVTDKWKSYNGNYFYLGSDGYMLTNELIEDGDNYYYVDANGAMVKNTWVAIAADDDETEDVDYRWYYFGPAGKAYKDSMGKTINGKKYGFDQDGKMYFGFIGIDGTSYNSEEDPIMQCTYYYGTNDDGARMTSAWLRYEDGISDGYTDDNVDDYDDDYYWFRFGSDGKKITSNHAKKINGQKYYFDANGVMRTEFANASTLTAASQTTYFSGNLEDGSLKKNAWIRTSMPDAWESLASYDEDDHWFRTDNNGKLVANQTKRVNSKWYAFNDLGAMQDGLVKITNAQKVKDANSSTFAGLVLDVDEDQTDADAIYAMDFTKDALFYFSNEEEKDGSMKTGSTVKISLRDDDYTFKFKKTSGEAVHGIDNHKLYDHGILQDAGDDTYALITLHNEDGTDGTAEFLVNKSGTICKENKWYKDANDYYWAVAKKVNSKDESAGYVIKRCNDKEEAETFNKANK